MRKCLSKRHGHLCWRLTGCPFLRHSLLKWNICRSCYADLQCRLPKQPKNIQIFEYDTQNLCGNLSVPHRSRQLNLYLCYVMPGWLPALPGSIDLAMRCQLSSRHKLLWVSAHRNNQRRIMCQCLSWWLFFRQHHQNLCSEVSRWLLRLDRE